MNLFLLKRQQMQIAAQSDKSMLWKVLDNREGISLNRDLWGKQTRKVGAGRNALLALAL